MFCPNCGKSNTREQKYCRACGLSLEVTLASLARQTDISRGDPLSHRKHRIEQILAALGLGGLAVFAAVMIYTIITKIIIDKGDLWSGLGFIAFFLAAIAAVLLVIYKEALADEIEEKSGLKAAQLNDSPTTNQLNEGHLNLPNSVTERTTELLDIKQQK
jgi:hypothetical protein